MMDREQVLTEILSLPEDVKAESNLLANLYHRCFDSDVHPSEIAFDAPKRVIMSWEHVSMVVNLPTMEALIDDELYDLNDRNAWKHLVRSVSDDSFRAQSENLSEEDERHFCVKPECERSEENNERGYASKTTLKRAAASKCEDEDCPTV